jgi:hypothetical protein
MGSSTFRLSARCSVDVAYGLALLFGIGTKPRTRYGATFGTSKLLNAAATAGSGRRIGGKI